MSPTSDDRFDFRKRVAYDPEAKRLFHRHARGSCSSSPRRSASSPATTICARTRAASPSRGEVTLHADRLYVQVSQPATGSDTGILFRSCEGRRDYVGGRNNFASLDLLHDPAALAR